MAKEILIVESDKKGQKEFQRIFQARRYSLVFSESGEHALLRVKLFKPDLIIAGLSPNEKNGLEVCRVVKTDPEMGVIPCILFSNVFDEISEEERKGALADGIITKPLDENEVLDLVDRLLEEGGMKAGREVAVAKQRELKSMKDFGEDVPQKEESLLLDELDDLEDGEIIELVDVVEEPEKKMSIDDFVGPDKEEPVSGITPLESWEKVMEEEEPSRKKAEVAPAEKEEKEIQAKVLPLQLDEEITLRDEIPEKEFFDKIELEDILQKVEMLRPALEAELPPEEKVAVPSPEVQSPEVASYDEAAKEESAEKYAGLAEFEAALKMGVGEGPPRGAMASIPSQEPKEEEIAEEAAEAHPDEMALEEELLKEALGEEAPKEEIPKEEVFEEEVLKAGVLKEEVFEEEVLKAGVLKEEVFEEEALKEGVLKEEAFEEEVLKAGALKEEVFEEEALKEGVLQEEVFEEEALKEKTFLEEALKEEVVGEEGEKGFPKSFLDELGEERIGLIPDVEGQEKGEEETREETLEILKGLEAAEVLPAMSEEAEILKEAQILKEEIKGAKIALEKRAETFETLKAPESVKVSKEAYPGLTLAERQVEDLISKGVREMMEGFMTRLVPELTENILNLTIERIERLVKEIVPELAEKLIQEEIKRLQSDEKEE